ncbi:MAG: DNA topoisomerase III [Amphiamblys sp. WSBS2006]|nr:MAG: DNA topoisomerase III [Amphiamblys sp. WSBS2006]
MHILNVAEKPSMAKTIAGILSGGKYTRENGRNKYCSNMFFSTHKNNTVYSMVMTSVMGHVSSLDFQHTHRNWQHTDPKELLVAPLETKTIQDMEKVKQNIEEMARKTDMLVIWTDCDREGEGIGMEIADIARNSSPKIKVGRARYSSVTKGDILNAFLNLSELDRNAADAVLTRQEIDLRIGSALTRYQTLLFKGLFSEKKVVSYGPCQFPTLGFVVEQYRRVEEFVPEAFWHIAVNTTRDKKKCVFAWARGRVFDRLAAFVLYERCLLAKEATVVSVTTSKTTRQRPLPLRTVEFLKKATAVLKFSAKKAMDRAEALYTSGYISYPRTETDMFDRKTDLKALVKAQTGHRLWGGHAAAILEKDRFLFPRKGRNNDLAHPPIHPTSPGCDLKGEDMKVYELITRHFLACCSHNAEGLETKVEIAIGAESFAEKGVVVTDRGYLDVYIYDKWLIKELPAFEKGEVFVPDAILLSDGRTSAPKLLTETELIAIMDKNGIGTDATMQDHIEKILERKYAERKAPFLFPTQLGIGIVSGYDRIDLVFSLTKPYLRAKMEKMLKEICDGKTQKQSCILEVLRLFERAYTRAEKKGPALVHTLETCLKQKNPAARKR